MDQEGQNNSSLNAETSFENADDTKEYSSNPTASFTGARGQESADPMIQSAVEHDQLKNIFDHLRELQKKTAMQCYVELYEEPEKEEIKKLADGLSEIGERLVAICDEEKASLSGIRESNDNGEIHSIIGQQQQRETQLKNLLELIGRVYFQILGTIDIYTDLAVNYHGELRDRGKEMKVRLLNNYLTDPVQSLFRYAIDSSAPGNDDSIANHQSTLVLNMLDELRNLGIDLESYGRGVRQSIDSSRYIFRVIKFGGPNFYKQFIFSQVVSLILYIFDVSSDVWLAFNYLSEGEILFFGLTVSFVVIPSIIISCIAHYFGKFNDDDLWSDEDYVVRILSTANVVMSMFYRYVKLIWYGCKGQRNMAGYQRIGKMQKKNWENSDDSDEAITIKNQDYFVLNYSNNMIEQEIMQQESETSLMRFLEGFMEGAPQLILQLTILKMEGFNSFYSITPESSVTMFIIRYVSLLTSLVSFARIPFSPYQTIRFRVFERNKSLKRYKEMNEEMKTCWMDFDAGFLYGDAVLFFAQFSGIVSRIIVLSQFASVYALPLLLICHYGELLVWLIKKKWNLYKNLRQKQFWKMMMIYVLKGFVNIFTFVGFTLSESRLEDEENLLELIFPLKDMFINYKYSAVCFAENTFFLVLYVLNALGFFGDHYDPLAANDGWSTYHTIFVVLQLLFYLFSLILFRYHSLCYSKKYQRWLREESLSPEWKLSVNLHLI